MSNERSVTEMNWVGRQGPDDDMTCMTSGYFNSNSENTSRILPFKL